MSEAFQFGFEPLLCSFVRCEEEAICGLKNKEDGRHINVCRKHFKDVTGKAYRGKPRVPKPELVR